MGSRSGDLFARQPEAGVPLADRMRPRNLDEYAGQGHILAPGKPLRSAIEAGRLHSMILWGPPGTGKTTLARLLAGVSGHSFETLSAVLAGVKEIRAAVDRARLRQQQGGQGTLLFIDEVHRFNKAQQDALLPHVEDGTLLLVGATTENPSFELNGALLSRARVYVLRALEPADLINILRHALTEPERGLGRLGLQIAPEQLEQLAQVADGDARRALNLLEIAADLAENGVIDTAVMQELLAGQPRRFDKGGDLFYDQISALHKAIRGSDPDASLYWLCRMLDGGCDPLYIARRMVRVASEDIGNADPRALGLALDAWDVQERLGSPEGELALGQLVLYLASVPKSNAAYQAFKAAQADARSGGSLEVPMHLRNAPTRLMKQLGHGKGYRYAHDEPDAFAAGATYFPEGMAPQRYYQPAARGFERQIAERLGQLRDLNQAARDGETGD